MIALNIKAIQVPAARPILIGLAMCGLVLPSSTQTYFQGDTLTDPCGLSVPVTLS